MFNLRVNLPKAELPILLMNGLAVKCAEYASIYNNKKTSATAPDAASLNLLIKMLISSKRS